MTEPETNPRLLDLDWAQLGRLLGDIQTDLVHREHLRGAEYYEQTARRFVAAAHLSSPAHVDRLVRGHRAVLEEQAHRIRAEAVDARDRFRAASRTMRQDWAAELRQRADNPHYVTGTHKRKGVLLAAEWLAPVGQVLAEEQGGGRSS